MVADSRDRKGGAVWTGPNRVRAAKPFENIGGSEPADVCIKIYARETFIPIHAENIVTVFLKGFPYAPSPGK